MPGRHTQLIYQDNSPLHSTVDASWIGDVEGIGNEENIFQTICLRMQDESLEGKLPIVGVGRNVVVIQLMQRYNSHAVACGNLG